MKPRLDDLLDAIVIVLLAVGLGSGAIGVVLGAS